jgi:hypothetical protein
MDAALEMLNERIATLKELSTRKQESSNHHFNITNDKPWAAYDQGMIDAMKLEIAFLRTLRIGMLFAGEE